MTKKLDGKIALVTGDSTGIGLKTAQRFVTEGAYVFITGRRQVELDRAVKTIGINCTGVQGDAGSLSDLDHLYNQIKRERDVWTPFSQKQAAAASVPSGLSPRNSKLPHSIGT